MEWVVEWDVDLLVELLAVVAGAAVEVVADVDAAVGGSAMAYHVGIGREGAWGRMLGVFG